MTSRALEVSREDIDISKIPPQPEISIGMVGHIDHGKTTLTEALTGIWTDTHSEELRRGITIKLGYADMAIYECPTCEPPQSFGNSPVCRHCGSRTNLRRMISFVDAPGHETLMATVLSGSALMDGAILVIAANEPCPQPQTREHLMALTISGIENVIIAQNKIDLVDEQRARENYREIKEFIKGTVAENSPIIPVSAQQRVNIDVLIAAIEEFIPTPRRDYKKDPLMFVARSFDVNRPGTPIEKLVGGVLGGSIVQGYLKVGDEIEIRPGLKETNYEPIYTEIVSIKKGGRFVDVAIPGGLVGIGTKLDPALTKADGLYGRIVGLPDRLPPIAWKLEVEQRLFEKVVGTEDQVDVTPLRHGELLMLSVGTAVTIGQITKLYSDSFEITLRLPVCAEEGWRVSISRRFGTRWRLIGYGNIKGIH